MRIAQITCNLECGGSMALVADLSAKFAELGHDVDVICLDRPTGSDHEKLWRRRLHQQGVSWRSLGRKVGHPGITSAAKLWSLVQRERYDIVHSHLPLPDAISGTVRRLSPVRFRHVLTVHNTQEPRPRLMAACGSGAAVVYCSGAARSRNPVSGAPSIVIPNGIVQSHYQSPLDDRAEIRRRLLLPGDALVVIAVGRLCPQKNFDAALDAIATLKRRVPDTDVRCVFCGDGPDRGRLEARARALSLDRCVQFLGNRTDVPALLAMSDAFLSTSLFEGMPLAVLEALTAGLPCVLSSIEEHFEIASTMPGCGFAPSSNPDEIASALELLMKDLPSSNVLRRVRAPLLERFSIATCASAYAALYQSLLRGLSSFEVCAEFTGTTRI